MLMKIKLLSLLFVIIILLSFIGCGEVRGTSNNSELNGIPQVSDTECHEIEKTLNGASQMSNTECGETQETSNDNESSNNLTLEKWEITYRAFLRELYKNEHSDDILEFSYRDLNDNEVPELIVRRGGVDITVYSYGNTLTEIGNYDFKTGTTKLFFSKNPLYPGMFCFFVGGGLEHYGYVTIKDNELIVEELWNEDYSGISSELGIIRNRIEELSTDKQLIEESRIAYVNNNEIEWTPLEVVL